MRSHLCSLGVEISVNFFYSLSPQGALQNQNERKTSEEQKNRSCLYFIPP